MPRKPANICSASQRYLHNSPPLGDIFQTATGPTAVCPECRRAVRLVALGPNASTSWATHSTQSPGAGLKPEELRCKLRTFSLTDHDVATLQKLGNGNASLGVRRALGILRAWNAVEDRTHWPQDLDAIIAAQLSEWAVHQQAAKQPTAPVYTAAPAPLPSAPAVPPGVTPTPAQTPGVFWKSE